MGDKLKDSDKERMRNAVILSVEPRGKCHSGNCEATAVFRVSVPKATAGSPGGAYTIRYLCGPCKRRFEDRSKEENGESR